MPAHSTVLAGSCQAPSRSSFLRFKLQAQRLEIGDKQLEQLALPMKM
jgi:hypothetical protein